MKNFVKIVLLMVVVLYGQQPIAEDKCNRTIDTSFIRSTRNSYEIQADKLKIDRHIKKWNQIASIIFTITLLLTLCGAIITVLQAGNSRTTKILVAVLGVCVTLLSLYRNELPDGTYQTYQKTIQKADTMKNELESYFDETKDDSLKPDQFKEVIASICKNIETLKTLKSDYSTNLPFPLDWFVTPVNAEIIVKNVSGTGSSRIEAKEVAEKRGLFEIQKEIQSKVDSELKQPIFSPLKQGIIDASMLAVQKESESFNGTNPVTYSISYQVDNSFIDNILNGISFPLVIFNTDSREPKVKVLSKDLSDYGFNVTEQPAPRGPSSETNAIFVGSGVPIDAIKKIVQLLVKADIPIKAIIYPWEFQKSKLEEKQKFNLVQIGGTKMLELSPSFSKVSLEKLKTITSQDEMVSFCKESTEALKKSWGLK